MSFDVVCVFIQFPSFYFLCIQCRYLLSRHRRRYSREKASTSLLYEEGAAGLWFGTVSVSGRWAHLAAEVADEGEKTLKSLADKHVIWPFLSVLHVFESCIAHALATELTGEIQLLLFI